MRFCSYFLCLKPPINTHVDISSEAGGLNFGLNPYSVNANSQ